MRTLLAALFALAAVAAAAQEAPVAPQPVAMSEPPPVTTGWASWYGWQFHGRTTANGETYDMHAMTAAHRTLPFDTVVRVSLIDGEPSVEVRINDRGPFVDDRIIDLSRAAADGLGMLRTGIAHVRLQVLSLPPPPRYVLQLGAFRERGNAESLMGQLTRREIPVRLEMAGQIIRVVTEPALEADLGAVEAALREAGIGGWLRRLATPRGCTRSEAAAAAPQARTSCPDGV